MADRDGSQKTRSRGKKKQDPAPAQNAAAAERGQEDGATEAKQPKSRKPMPSKGKVTGPPRRPIQVVGANKSFWVFCDDGTVCAATFKKGALRWYELEPPLPGSPADRLRELPSDVEELT
jgi:hypothetical protein